MNNGNLQYIANTISIELLASDISIQKRAGLFDDFGFSGVASSIIDKVKSLFVQDDSPAGWIKAISNILISGALFGVHPLLGIVYAAANALGIDIIGIGKQVLSSVYHAIQGGANVVMSSISNYGKMALDMHDNGLLKTSFTFNRNRNVSRSYRGSGKPRIRDLFMDLFRAGKTGKLKTLVVAIIMWTLKTALFGAGIVGATGLVAGFLKGKTKQEPITAEPTTPEPTETESTTTEPSETEQQLFDKSLNMPPIGLSPSGRGTGIYKNDHDNYMWIVPIVGDLKQTLVMWAKDIYPALSGYEDIIYSSPAFLNIVNKFNEYYDLGASSTLVPKGYVSRKQVVDAFVNDVYQKIKKLTKE